MISFRTVEEVAVKAAVDSPARTGLKRPFYVEVVFIDGDGSENQCVLSPLSCEDRYVATSQFISAVKQSEANVESLKKRGVQMKYVVRRYNRDTKSVEEKIVE